MKLRAKARSRVQALWLLCVAALLLVNGPAGALNPSGRAEPAWQALNDGLPGRVGITSLAGDPRDDRRIYVGTTRAEGLWISDDGGLTGHFASKPLAGRIVHALSVDPARPNEILAGTDAGLYRSGAAGRTWQREGELLLTAVYALARDAKSAVLAGGAGPEIYRRDAEGANWRKLAALPGGTAAVSLAASPRGDLILAGTDRAGLFRSRDGGRSWKSVSAIGPFLVAGLTLADRDGRVAFVRTRAGLYATADGGETWRPEALDLPGHADVLVASSTGEVYVGTSEGAVYRRAPGSRSLQPWGSGIGMPGLFSSLTLASRTRWYAGTSNGLYLSDDAGLTWRLAEPGPGRATVTALAMTAAGALLLGSPDGVFRSVDGGRSWQLSSTGLPADIAGDIAPANGSPGLVYAALAGKGLYRSLDGGRSWTPTGWASHGAPAVLVDPRNARRLFIVAAYERAYESRDGGETWETRWEGMDLSTQVIALAMDPRQPDTLYAGATEGLFRSDDGAAHWQSVGPELSDQTVFTIALNREDGRKLYAGATNGAYRSQDRGEHWERLGQGLEDVTVTALAFNPRDADLVFAGTKYRGIYRSDDGGLHWQAAGPGPVSVNDLLFTPDGQWLYGATSAGFYRLNVGAR